MFFLIFKYASTKYRKESFNKLAHLYITISFLLSSIGVLLCFYGKQFSFNGHFYGVSDGYGYGCMSSAIQNGNIAFFSIIMSTYLLGEGKFKKNFIHKINILLQLLCIYECAMREFILEVFIFGGLIIFLPKVKFKGKNFNNISFIFLVLFIALLGALFLYSVKFRNRNVDATIAMRNYDNISSIDVKNDDDDKSATIAYSLILYNSTLRILDNISTRRIGIWITALLSLRNNPLLGIPSTTIRAVMKGRIMLVDFHNSYIRAMRIYGMIGVLPFFTVLFMLLKKCINTIKSRHIISKGTVTIAVAILCLMINSSFGGALSASFDWTVFLFWLFSGIIININDSWTGFTLPK